MLWLMNTWRIQKNNLTFVICMNTKNAIPRRLGFIRHNRHFLFDNMIDQCRFSNIRPPYNSNKTRFKVSFQINSPHFNRYLLHIFRIGSFQCSNTNASGNSSSNVTILYVSSCFTIIMYGIRNSAITCLQAPQGTV